MSTEFKFGKGYAEFLVANDEGGQAIDAMCSRPADIPPNDYNAIVQSGVKNPDADEYWRGFNSFFGKD